MAETTASTEKSTQAALLELRNKALAKRFHELYQTRRMRHDDVLEALSNEFYITPRTIRGVLKTAPPYVEEQPALKEPGRSRKKPLLSDAPTSSPAASAGE